MEIKDKKLYKLSKRNPKCQRQCIYHYHSKTDGKLFYIFKIKYKLYNFCTSYNNLKPDPARHNTKALKVNNKHNHMLRIYHHNPIIINKQPNLTFIIPSQKAFIRISVKKSEINK